ncbi:MAG: ABC transporter ATP-binding protein [Salibacteraceae bacterium]
MVEINLEGVGRRFNINWIFRKINATLKTNQHVVILGSNGSGKSTLLKILSGIVSPSEGKVSYQVNGLDVKADSIYKHISICTPYLSLPEELTLDELLKFHQKLKPLDEAYTGKPFAEKLHLDYQPDKDIHLYSSGMKQRVKLGLALFSKNPILLLDEPLSNLDEEGKNWYLKMIDTYQNDRLIIVCSNEVKNEYIFCSQTIDITDYKPES